jgi:hypothetical protein
MKRPPVGIVRGQKGYTMYYEISESAARKAKEANSYDDYREGSATAGYRAQVDEAYRMAEECKAKVDPMYHEKIDYYADLYARKLAENTNKRNEIDARCPSILISGGGNFPTRKKEKQNAARDKNWAEYEEIQGLLRKMRSVGHGGIMSDDARAVEKLEMKLEALEREQVHMKAVNAYWRKHKTLDDCPELTAAQREEVKADMSRSWRVGDNPYPAWALSNNNANIRRIRERIESLKKEQERREQPTEEEHDGYILRENAEACRIQFVFDDKPEENVRAILKANGFRWAPSEGAWQRMLNDNGRYAAQKVIKEMGAGA